MELPDWLTSLFSYPTMPQEGWKYDSNPVGTERTTPPQQLGLAGPIDPVDNRLNALTGGIRTQSQQDFSRMVGNIAAGAVGDAGPVGGVSGGLLGTFGGAKFAKAPDLKMLGNAKILEGWGASPDMIWQKTGWGRNANGGWRFEIPDQGAMIDPQGLRGISTPNGRMYEPHEGVSLSGIIDHPELFNQYPPLEKIPVTPISGQGYSGMWNGNRIELAPHNLGDLMPTLLHEVQHALQTIEGFPGGSAPSWFADHPQVKSAAPRDQMAVARQLYKQTAGEVESNLVEDRIPLSDSQRRLFSPELEENTPRGQQAIVKLGPNNSVNVSNAKPLVNLGSEKLQIPGGDLADPMLRPLIRELALEGWVADSKAGPVYTFRKVR